MLQLTQTITIDSKIQSLIIEFEAINKALQLVHVPTERVSMIRGEQTLHSALFSAKIEGNPLTIEQFHTNPSSSHKVEVQNICRALNKIYDSPETALNEELLLKLHKLVMANLSPSAGVFRTEQSAIFNQAGIAIYITPPDVEIRPLLSQMFSQFNQLNIHPVLKAAILHFQFEKIHPFLDGNGRVGRLLIHQVLKSHNLALNGLVGFENYVETNKDEYYDLLAMNTKDITEFAYFLLNALIQDSQIAIKKTTSTPQNPSKTTLLLPRRQEIIHIISDHQSVNFDMLHRRFLAIPPSTLRYDLLQLQRKGYIKKLGTTKGVLYILNKEN